MSMSPRGPAGTGAGGTGRPGSRWLVVADDGVAADLCRLAGVPPFVPAGPGSIADAVSRARPALVVIAAPPASSLDIDLLAAVRRRRPSMRVLLVDRPDAVQERLWALELGFDAAVPSSIAPEELFGRARLLEARRGSGTDGVSVADGVELDPVAHEVRRDGTVVHLRPKEFGLLALLASHPGRAFTRQQLLDRVWGPNTGSHPRTVDVHVRWLRSKLERDPGRPVNLVTVRCIGYRLDPPDC